MGSVILVFSSMNNVFLTGKIAMASVRTELRFFDLLFDESVFEF